MRLDDVVAQAIRLAPHFTTILNPGVEIASISRSGTQLTVVTRAAHGLATGDPVHLTGASTPLACTFTRSGAVGTIVTTEVHDRTFGPGMQIQRPNVTVSGATEAEFNGTFAIASVPNRKTITVVMTDSGPTTATGAPVVEDGFGPSQSVNTAYAVATVPNLSTFTVAHPDSAGEDPLVSDALVKGGTRCSGVASPAHMLNVYTPQVAGAAWLFVVLEDVTASQDRRIESDATSDIRVGDFYRQQILEPVTFYLWLPAADEIAARAARDVAGAFFRPLCRMMLNAQFDSQLAVGPRGSLQFTAHGRAPLQAAEGVYVHAFSFQAVTDLTDEDTHFPEESGAFRDLDITLFPNTLDQGNLLDEIDLDDVPL